MSSKTKRRKPKSEAEPFAQMSESSTSNQPPILFPLQNQTAHPVTGPVSFVATAYDPEGDPLTFTLVDGPSSASLDPDTGEFN